MATALQFDLPNQLAWSEPLINALDLLGQRVAITDATGRLKYATRSFAAALAVDADRNAIASALRESAQAACGTANLQATAGVRQPPQTRVVVTGRGPYKLSSAFLGNNLFGWGPTVVVQLEVPPLDPLEHDRLAREFGLTRAQSKVARLLALGLRNDEIATRLFLSTHTVRHHLEQIRTKVGGHTRAATAALLRSATGDRVLELGRIAHSSTK